MSRTIITSGTTDSYQRLVGAAGGTWAATRLAIAATSMSDSLTNYNFGVFSRYISGRGGNQFFNTRSYFTFDCSGIVAGTHVNHAYITLYLDSVGTTDGVTNKVELVDSDSLASSTGDYNNVFDGASMRRTFIDTPVIVSDTAGHHIFPLNSSGKINLQGSIDSGGDLTVGLISSKYDYGDVAPPLGGVYIQIITYYANASAAYRPLLVIDFDDAVFMGANF
jgi:hypothetical protein